MSTKKTPKASKTTAPKPAKVDTVAKAYDELDDHDRHEILSGLGTSVVELPRVEARKRFAELAPSVQDAVRVARQG